MTVENYRDFIENGTCPEYIKRLYDNWHKNNKIGDPNVTFVKKIISKGRTPSLVYDIDYDYIPTDIYRIDRLIESVEEWVNICKPKYGDIEVTWKGSYFPNLILSLVLFIEGRKGVCILDTEWNKYYTKTLLSGNMKEIDLLHGYDPLGIYGEISKLVYICWMPIFSREQFNLETVKEFEILLYRIALQASDFIGKNGRTRDDEVSRTRGIAKSSKRRDDSKILAIEELWKEYQGIHSQRDIAGLIARKLGVTPKHARETAKKAGLYKK